MRLVLVDDHPIFTESLGLLLQAIAGVDVVGELNDGSLLPEFLRNTPADIVICDIRMPGLNGIETTRLIKAEFPQVHVIMLSVEEDIGLLRGAPKEKTLSFSPFLIKKLLYKLFIFRVLCCNSSVRKCVR